MDDNENEVQEQIVSPETPGTEKNGYTQASGNPTFQQMQQPYQTQSFGDGQIPPSKSTLSDQGLAIAGMVLGILSLLCCCFMPFSAILAVAGLVLSIVSLAQKKPGKGMAIAGIICSAIGLLLVILMIIFMGLYGSVYFDGSFLEGIQDLQEDIQQGNGSVYYDMRW